MRKGITWLRKYWYQKFFSWNILFFVLMWLLFSTHKCFWWNLKYTIFFLKRSKQEFVSSKRHLKFWLWHLQEISRFSQRLLVVSLSSFHRYQICEIAFLFLFWYLMTLLVRNDVSVSLLYVVFWVFCLLPSEKWEIILRVSG